MRRFRRSIAAALCAAILSGTHPQAMAADQAASPAPASSSAMPFMPFQTPEGKARKVVYVLATSGDAPTRARFVSTLTERLQTGYDLATTILVPQPDWGVSDYISACQNFPANTSGALIVGIGATTSGAHSYFVGRSNWTQIHAVLLYSRCEASPAPVPTPTPSSPTPVPVPTPMTGGSTVVTTPNTKDPTKDVTVVTTNWTVTPKPAPSPNYSIRWQSQLKDERGTVGFLTPLPALAFLMTLVAGYTAIAPSRTSQGVTTTVFATPPPFVPFPSRGAVTMDVETRASTTNVSQFGGIATAFLPQSLAYSGSVQATATPDEQGLKAIRNVVNAFLDELQCPRKKSADSKATPAPAPALSGTSCPFLYFSQKD